MNITHTEAPSASRSTARDHGIAFTDGAAQFAQWNDLLWLPAAEELAEHAHLRHGDTVLDACCGAGATTVAALKRVGHDAAIDGVDLSSGLLSMAAQQLSDIASLNVTLTEADVTTWRGHRMYDAVLCGYSMFFFHDMAASVEHLGSMLKPGGSLTVNTWAAGALSPLAETIFAAALTERPRLATASPRPNRNMAIVDSTEKMERFLRSCGFSDVDVVLAPRQLSVDVEKAWALVMGSGWRTLLPRVPEAIARVKQVFIRSLSDYVDSRTGELTFNSDTLIARAIRPAQSKGSATHPFS